MGRRCCRRSNWASRSRSLQHFDLDEVAETGLTSHFDFEVDVVDVDSYWVVLACITIFSVNFPIVSLLAPKTEREDKLGHLPTQFDLDMATHQDKSLG